MISLARVISFLSNPVFIAVPLLFLLVYHETNSLDYAWKWMIFSMMFVVMVGAFVLYEVRRRIFTDFDVSRKEQRPLFFVFVTFISLLYLMGLFILEGPVVLYLAVGSILGSALILGMVSQRIKVSLHVATLSAFLTVLVILYGGGYFFLLLLVIPLVAWSRIRIKRHTFPEVITGCCLGIMLTLIVYAGVAWWR